MNKEQMIEKFFDKLLKYADSAEVFASDQVPLYIEELLKYGALEKITNLIVYSTLCLVVLIFGIILLYVHNKLKKEKMRYDGWCLPFSFSMFILVIMLMSVPVSEFLDYQKIKIAPRVYIMEELRK